MGQSIPSIPPKMGMRCLHPGADAGLDSQVGFCLPRVLGAAGRVAAGIILFLLLFFYFIFILLWERPEPRAVG